MDDGVSIKVDRVSKTFELPHEKVTSVKSAVVNFRNRNRSFEKQQVLHDISFEIKKGEFFGIVGRNGSGKSTLLKLLAGIYTPDEGTIEVNGKLTPFIELGVGFNPELTGRENVFLNGALLGFNRAEMLSMYDAIVSFAELERFMDQKLKNYSSGMQVRLAFSIAIRAKSDILLIDEVLAVGDAAFQSKCFDYFQQLKKSNTTVIFVSHDRTSLERFCRRGILINDGKLIQSGSIQKVLQSYSTVVLEELGNQEVVRGEVKTEEAKPVVRYAQIQQVRTLDESGNRKKKFSFGDKVSIAFEVKMHKRVSNPVVGVTIWKKNVEQAIFATNTLIGGFENSGVYEAGDVLTLQFELPTSLNDGEYRVEPAVANESASIFLDQNSDAATFYISGSNNPHALMAGYDKMTIKRKA